MDRFVYFLLSKPATLLFGFTTLISCSTTPSQPDNSTVNKVESITSAPPEKTVENLLVWLEKHSEQADERNCFELDGVDATAIDTECLEKHLAGLRQTSLFSQFYLNQIQKEYSVMSSDIKAEGYAATKDYDRYFNSQDPPTFAATLDILKKTKGTITARNEASVSLSFGPTYTLVYQLVKENDTWKIKSIE
jgi:hypothetical protein